MKLSNNESSLIWLMKNLSILTIFFAHMPYKGTSELMESLFNVLGTWGVPTFFALSGFLVYKSKSSLSHKVKGLLFPLLFWGSITFLIMNVPSYENFKYNFFIEYIRWVYGSGTWLYFVPVLIWCHVLYRYLNIYVLVGLCVLNMICNMQSLIIYNDVFTAYVNPFNYLLYYIMGVFLRYRGISLYRNQKLIPCIVLIFGFVFIYIHSIRNFDISSITISGFLCRIIGIFFIYYLSSIIYTCFSNKNFSLNNKLGKLTFVVYFSHMYIAGIIHVVFTQYFPILQFSKIICAFAVTIFFVLLMEYILNKLKFHSLAKYLGFR